MTEAGSKVGSVKQLFSAEISKFAVRMVWWTAFIRRRNRRDKTRSVCIAFNCFPETQTEVCRISVGSFTNCIVQVPLWSRLSWRLHRNVFIIQLPAVSCFLPLSCWQTRLEISERCKTSKKKDFSTTLTLRNESSSWHELHTPWVCLWHNNCNKKVRLTSLLYFHFLNHILWKDCNGMLFMK